MQDRCPEPVQAVLAKLTDPKTRDFDGWDVLPDVIIAEVLEVPPPEDDRAWWVRSQISSLSLAQACAVLPKLTEGQHDADAVNKAFARAGLGLELVDGEIYDADATAVELGVDDVPTLVSATISGGRYGHVGTQWRNGVAAEESGDKLTALACYTNALEGAARTASGKNSINDGVKALYPDGVFAPLRSAIVQLHNFASAFPGARHGSAAPMALDAATLTGVKRAAGAWIVMIATENP